MGLKIIDRVQGEAQTTDAATQITVVSYTVPSNGAYHAEGTLVGREANGDAVSAKIAARFSRVGGTLAIIGTLLSITPIGGSAAISTAAATIDSSGDAIRLRVNGVILKTIDWYGDLRIWAT